MGLTSIIMATTAKTVYCTDVGEDLLSMCKRNVALNRHLMDPAGGDVKVRQFDWLQHDLCTDADVEYSWTEEEVADLYDNTRFIIAADVCYDDDLTDGFFRTLYRLCTNFRHTCTIFISLEKRLNFTLRHMDVSCEAYDHFIHCLSQLQDLEDGRCSFRAEQLQTNFVQFLLYERIERLVSKRERERVGANKPLPPQTAGLLHDLEAVRSSAAVLPSCSGSFTGPCRRLWILGPLQLSEAPLEVPGPTLENSHQTSERLVAGSLPTGPGRAQPEMADVGPPSSRLTTLAGRSMRGRCNVVWVAVVAGSLDDPIPGTKTLAIGTWNVTSLGGKEPELVREVERYRLEIVGLTSTHSLGSGTQLLERGWTLHYSGVAQGERRRAGVGLLHSSPAQPPRVGVHPGEREGRFPAPSGWG
ncbi:hypothetical protein L3Q82_002912 [Scortum barcoo]|uniref:Uncharacterized protein n=1 Tax=Scortum barcoo TaxID=214431 RepID=A0ACB8VVI0_9TELE|nr:hypothetical protein L3Q82_002912 [Scortum barcoo]